MTHTDSTTKSILSSVLSEAVLLPGILNLTRDWTWAFLSYDLLNMRLTQTDDADFDAQGQWLSQQCYSSLAMLFSLAAMAVFYKLKKPKDAAGELKQFPWAEGFIYLIAASVSIYGWDRLQVAGITLGKNKGLSDNNAGYAAAALTGLEGFIQYSTIVMLRTLTLSHYYTAFKEDTAKYTKQLLKGLACSLTFVAAPGASWQIMFMLGTSYQWGVIATSCAVALTVAFFNYTSVQMSIAFLRWLSTPPVENVAIDVLNDTIDASAPVVIAINETADPLIEVTDATPLLKPKGWGLIKKHVVERKDIPSLFASAKNAEPEIDYMPTAARKSTGEAPLGKILSGITKALSARKLSARAEALPAPLPTTLDPEFGALVTEESGVFTPR